MNKKLFLGMFAAAGMLLATSCSNDELDVVQSGNEAQVTFSLVADGGIATRAISDGTGAKKLVYAVYDAQGELITTIANADVNGQIVDNSAFDTGLTENVTITLAKGQQYTVAFWAQNPNCTAYTTTDLKNVKVDYAGLNNDETRDAFFNAETFTVTGDATIDVVLKRPFAQINVGIYQSDWDAAVASEIEIEKSKVTIEKAATSINLLTGKVGGEQTVEYSFDIIPAKFTVPETLDVDLDNDGTKEHYVYLSMSYILASDATTGYAKTTLEDLDFTFAPISGNNINFGEGLNSVPVQRNWRTNIIGQILTGDVTFNITIDPIYDGEYNNYLASSNEDITNAISAGVTTISLTPGTYIIPDDAQGKTLTFIGTGNPEDTKIATQDDGSYEGCDYSLDGATVTFENITINTDSEDYTGYARCKGTYKNCVINGTYTLYGDSKFENCTFNVSGDVYNIRTWVAPNATFDKCTFNSDGKAMLLYGTENTNLKIENSVFNDKGGLTDKKAAIEIGNDYGKSYTLVVNNTVVNGYEINDKGINTGTTLWANKNSMGTDKLSVTIDGEKVY